MYIYGRNVIKEIISIRYSVKQVYVSNSKNTDKELASIVQKAKSNGYSVSYVSDDNLKNLVNYDKHQGVVIDIGKDYEYYDTDYLEKKKENAFIVMLDQIQDPQNFGAIIRSAVACGADAIVIPKDNSCEVTAAVIKVSAGQIFKIPIIRVVNLSRTVEYLKEKNYWIFAADMNGKNYYDNDFKGNICLILGNEGSGIREKLREKADFIVSIPMYNSVESLNVSVSAGIIMFEAAKQRHGI